MNELLQRLTELVGGIKTDDNSVNGLTERAKELEQERTELKNNIKSAIGGRTATISQLTTEIGALTNLQETV